MSADQEMNQVGLMSLPNEILAIIVKSLDFEASSSFMQTNRQGYAIVNKFKKFKVQISVSNRDKNCFGIRFGFPPFSTLSVEWEIYARTEKTCIMALYRNKSRVSDFVKTRNGKSSDCAFRMVEKLIDHPLLQLDSLSLSLTHFGGNINLNVKPVKFRSLNLSCKNKDPILSMVNNRNLECHDFHVNLEEPYYSEFITMLDAKKNEIEGEKKNCTDCPLCSNH